MTNQTTDTTDQVTEQHKARIRRGGQPVPTHHYVTARDEVTAQELKVATVAALGGGEVVYELLDYSGTTHGLHRSVEGAQARGAEVFKSYQDLTETLTEEERESTEEIFENLTWTRERLTIARNHPVGDPVLMGRYSERGYFYVKHRALMP